MRHLPALACLLISSSAFAIHYTDGADQIAAKAALHQQRAEYIKIIGGNEADIEGYLPGGRRHDEIATLKHLSAEQKKALQQIDASTAAKIQQLQRARHTRIVKRRRAMEERQHNLPEWLRDEGDRVVQKALGQLPAVPDLRQP